MWSVLGRGVKEIRNVRTRKRSDLGDEGDGTDPVAEWVTRVGIRYGRRGWGRNDVFDTRTYPSHPWWVFDNLYS